MTQSKTPQSNKTYDYVIIGGGIHGVGIAQAAAAAGYSVLVLEQASIAHGTSSKSSKLIHGGLRYLETAQIKLVFECLSERTLLLELAPDIVRLEPFYIPIYKKTTRRPWEIWAGLTLYAALGKLNSDARFETVPEEEWTNLDGISTENLQAVFRYKDGATDDAALTKAVMHSASTLGAELVMPATFISADADVDSNVVNYSVNGTIHSCKARLLVNAAGPWANLVLEKVNPTPKKREFDLIAGTHIVLDSPSPNGMFYVEAPQDRRAVFVMPWKGKTMVGTTETVFKGDPSKVRPLESEETYLCEVIAHYFPKFKGLTRENIDSSFAGLRVLPHASGKAFSRPRETTFHVDKKIAPRIITIYGGKLTAYRITAEKFVAKFAKKLPKRKRIAYTNKLPLTHVTS
ncbi:MAG TPA: FAD-dependent oxidoreductase [Flavobacteriales bacterium]|jgi:glycerol-3-phosphate dehydrogenase|nr:FAD-dependent oxidoreductase [Flavobacteriales bacterium]HIB76336.1 FAD-dependent oxidoreductase [Flavobacteriales bacterium]HIN41857.1 FAD-dependent oxidoreductase [Flavobacteriales bacterium]HIO16212.1 FAD-dependent oxidoreductase [Flavobacteriales bacterium]HIO60174.1 FAD-dependent oxidoreductase [Flavobacteriales bacterium]